MQTSEERSTQCKHFSYKNWVNGWCSQITLCPRGAFTGTYPKESNLKPSQCSWRSHTQWTYGQSPIVCCAIYGSVVCHLFCLSETSMTPVWILNKRLFLMYGRRLLSFNRSLYITNDWHSAFLIRLTVMRLFLLMKFCTHNDCQVSYQKSDNQRIVEASGHK